VGLGRRTFAPGEVLTASNVMNYLQDQAVMNFAGTAARGSAIGTAVQEGMVTYQNDSNTMTVYDGANWQQVYPSVANTGEIVQVLQTVKTDTFSSSSTSFTDITGMSVTITPKSASNKILVQFHLSVGSSSNNLRNFKIVRNSTDIAIGDSAGSRIRATVSNLSNDSASSTQVNLNVVSFTFLDTPNTTSATTYKIQIVQSSGIGYINRTHIDTDSSALSRTASTITVMEVVA
jgi:hypothetical protein